MGPARLLAGAAATQLAQGLSRRSLRWPPLMNIHVRRLGPPRPLDVLTVAERPRGCFCAAASDSTHSHFSRLRGTCAVTHLRHGCAFDARLLVERRQPSPGEGKQRGCRRLWRAAPTSCTYRSKAPYRGAARQHCPDARPELISADTKVDKPWPSVLTRQTVSRQLAQGLSRPRQFCRRSRTYRSPLGTPRFLTSSGCCLGSCQPRPQITGLDAPSAPSLLYAWYEFVRPTTPARLRLTEG